MRMLVLRVLRTRYALPASLLPCLGLLVALPAYAGTTDARWVQTAWQEVRDKPNSTAAIVAHWPANTTVSLGKQEGEWCQAKPETGEIGFVPCKVLGATPLTLQMLNDRRRAGAERDDMEALSFWVAPSVKRFAQAGINMNWHRLTAQQKEREERSQQPVRFSLPEFEAMKQRLRQGVVPRMEEETTRIDIETFISAGPLPPWFDRQGYLKRFLTPNLLPVAKSSLFRRHTDVLSAFDNYGDATDAIIAMQGQPATIRYAGKPVWVTGHHDAGVESIWDIGHVDVRYARPAFLLAISYEGFIEARTIAGSRVGGSDYDDGCAEGYPTLPVGDFVPGWPRLKHDRLMALYLSALPPNKKVDVLTRKKQVAIPENDYSDNAPSKLTNVLVRSIDLDQDGIADLSVMELPENGPVSEMLNQHRYFFVNVNGRWWYTGEEVLAECT